jgi:ribosomal protein L11 methylase PrmA
VFGAESGLWDSCSVVAHFPLDHNIPATLQTAWEILGDMEDLGEDLEAQLAALAAEDDGAADATSGGQSSKPAPSTTSQSNRSSSSSSSSSSSMGSGSVAAAAASGAQPPAAGQPQSVIGTWSYSIEQVINAEWVEQIKASYVPLKINPKLYIIPTWSEPEDPTAVNITLEPGVAFGTGE